MNETFNENFTAAIKYAIVVNKCNILHIFHAPMQYLQSKKEYFATDIICTHKFLSIGQSGLA